MYYRLFQKYGDNNEFKENAKFLLIDFNGEYSKAITKNENKEVYELSTGESGSTNKFPIKEEQIKDVEFWSILLEATEKTQKPFLEKAIDWDWSYKSEGKWGKKKIFEFDEKLIRNIIKGTFDALIDKSNDNNKKNNVKSENGKNIGKLEIVKFLQVCNKFLEESSLDKIISSLRKKQALIKDDGNFDSINIKTSDLGKIRLGIVFRYYDDLAKGDLNPEHISPLLNKLHRIDDLDKIITIKITPKTTEKEAKTQDNQANLTIISLHDVKQDMKKVFPLLVANQYYAEKKKENNKQKYLNIIIDEAHNILSDNSSRESETWKDYRLETFEEIIKEGRKFGVFLTIASQRPSDISDTIISQLHNYFLHRLVNEKDILAIGKTVSYLDKISFESLPILPTGSCILAGLSAQIPVIIDVDKIDKECEPDNKTIIPTNYWENPKASNN